MDKTFTRQELYDLVWSEPMRLLAAKYDISDRGLAKACQRANIPVPERGYWNKLQAGKKVVRCSLPGRGIGMSDRITVGGNRWTSHYLTDEEALVMTIPPPPEFPEGIEKVKARVKTMVGKTRIPKTLSKPHYLISRLLAEDEARRQKGGWEKPVFDTPFERRRLKILNSIFSAVDHCGMKSSVDSKTARDLSVTVGDSLVRFTLESQKAGKLLERERQGYCFMPRGDHDPMTLQFSSFEEKVWKDTETDKVEDHIGEIVEEIIIGGEVLYRDNAMGTHKWYIKRKLDAQQKELKRQEESARQHRAHLEKLEKQRVSDLLDQATALRQATDIRNYVKAARDVNPTLNGSMLPKEFEDWANWALDQADRIDPIKSGEFRKRKTQLDENAKAVSGRDSMNKNDFRDSYDPAQERNWFQEMNSWPRKRA